MKPFDLPETVSLPQLAFELSEHLGFSNTEDAKWAWLELSGAVLSHYLVDKNKRFNALIHWFYQDLGFCQREDYFSAEAADLAITLKSRQGNSTTLATLLLLLSKQLDLEFDLLFLPGTTVLRSQIDDEIRFIDALTGKDIDRSTLHALVRGELGNHAQLKSKYFKPANDKRLISRLLHELKAGCIVSQQYEKAIECCNLLMQWHSDDIHLSRERAYVAEQLGCIKVAVDDLQYFVDNNPHDPVTELVRMQLEKLNQHAEIYH
ncbi:MAG: tetratricopeptide repeat protein [Shewanella sp.]|nr:tetratricopeptide repeat protein [Shewanella sp.]